MVASGHKGRLFAILKQPVRESPPTARPAPRYLEKPERDDHGSSTQRHSSSDGYHDRCARQQALLNRRSERGSKPASSRWPKARIEYQKVPPATFLAKALISNGIGGPGRSAPTEPWQRLSPRWERNRWHQFTGLSTASFPHLGSAAGQSRALRLPSKRTLSGVSFRPFADTARPVQCAA